MRMRKKKNRESRLAACTEFLLENITAPMENPAETLGMQKNAPVYLEIGAGKGGFACGMATRHKDAAYFAMEKVTDCVVLAAEKARSVDGGVENLRFIIDTADNLMKIFGTGTVDRIFLNFSDPWSKKGYAKRRLTHRRYLALYFNLLKDGGKITFKTDNVGLFDFSLEEISDMGITPDFVTRDLHNSERAEGNVMTEYETNFSSMGISINMLEVTKPAGFNPVVNEEFTAEKKDYFKK